MIAGDGDNFLGCRGEGVIVLQNTQEDDTDNRGYCGKSASATVLWPTYGIPSRHDEPEHRD